MEKVIVIVGPTAVGKTSLSIQLAKQLNSEIISGDSMQIYKDMDIGTGKVTEDEMENIPHHMLDIKEASETFSVAEFQQLVQKHITNINNKGKIPIIVGGTGLYIQAVLYNYHFSDQKRDEVYTKELERLLEKEGNMSLYRRLEAVDPDQAKKIHPNNYRRVIRALEVYHTTGKTMSERQAEQSKESMYQFVIIGLEMEREKLYQQINKRVNKMVDDGLLAEVKRLYNRGLKDTQAMKAIGYKELIPYFEGEISLEDAIELLKQNSRRYAKRQFTWFKNQMDVKWFNAEKLHEPNYITNILHYIENSLTKND